MSLGHWVPEVPAVFLKKSTLPSFLPCSSNSSGCFLLSALLLFCFVFEFLLLACDIIPSDAIGYEIQQAKCFRFELLVT